jgi:hypothetical protein
LNGYIVDVTAPLLLIAVVPPASHQTSRQVIASGRGARRKAGLSLAVVVNSER